MLPRQALLLLCHLDNVNDLFTIMYYTAGVSLLSKSDADEGAGYLALALNAPPQHTPHNYSPNLSLSVGMDLDKLKVPHLSYGFFAKFMNESTNFQVPRSLWLLPLVHIILLAAGALR